MYLVVYKKTKSKWFMASNPTKSLKTAQEFSEKIKKDALNQGLDIQVSIQSFSMLDEIPEILSSVKSEKLLLN